MHDWVLLRLPNEQKEEKKTTSGLILMADSHIDENLPTAEVLSFGPGTYDYNGNLHPVQVQAGDIVMYMKQGVEYEDSGDKFYLIHASSIVAIVKE